MNNSEGHCIISPDELNLFNRDQGKEYLQKQIKILQKFNESLD